MKFNPILILVTILAITSCASPPKLGKAFYDDGITIEGKSKVYFYRPSRDGKIMWPRIYINNELVSELPVESYSYVFLPPGVYHLKSPQVEIFSEKESDNPKFVHKIDFEVKNEKEIYLRFGFYKQRGRVDLAFAGSNPVAYSSSQAHFDWTILKDGDRPKDIENCKVVISE